MTRRILTLSSAIALASVSLNAGAVTLLIGDVDGFGYVNPNASYLSAQGVAPDTNGNGVIEPGEYLPDLDGDGAVHVTRNDEFDNREANEVSSTNGAQWTDVSLEDFFVDTDGDPNFGNSPADGLTFTFNFAVPTMGDADFGVDHFINFVFGDYDVTPARLIVDGTVVPLTAQSNADDGLAQLAYADIAWASMTDGEVIIQIQAPNEPYLAVDYAYLHTENTAAPLPDSGQIPAPAPLALLGFGLLAWRFGRKSKA